jgi:hypothetical protein
VPIDYSIRDGLLTGRASGVLDDEALLAYVHRVIADPDYETTSADLFDARGVTDVRLTAEGIRTIAAIIRQSGRSSARVAVIAESPAMFGMARMFEQLREDIEVVVFRDAEAAREWLLTPPAPEAPDPR